MKLHIYLSIDANAFLCLKVLNLNEGMSYYFRVMAENDHGIGQACETTDAIKASEVPSAPGKLEVSQVTARSVSLVWTKPDADGGSKITGKLDTIACAACFRCFNRIVMESS